MTTNEPCGDDCQLCEADRLAREAYLARHSRYNTSAKGQRRNRRYEDAHPERKLRWEPARNALRAPLPPVPETPMHNGADLPPEPGPETAGGVAKNRPVTPRAEAGGVAPETAPAEAGSAPDRTPEGVSVAA
jgi:hypothetical protein